MKPLFSTQQSFNHGLVGCYLYNAIAQKLGVVSMAEQALAQAGQQALLARLRAELQQVDRGAFAGANIHIEQSGGVSLGIGNTIGSIGDLVGGNKG